MSRQQSRWLLVGIFILGVAFGRRFTMTGNPWDIVIGVGAVIAWWVTVEAVGIAPRVGLLRGGK